MPRHSQQAGTQKQPGCPEETEATAAGQLREDLDEQLSILCFHTQLFQALLTTITTGCKCVTANCNFAKVNLITITTSDGMRCGCHFHKE